ncbi:hypothetical protein ES705_14617 [subsurface metagenome]
MECAFHLIGWQLSFGLTLCRQKPSPDLKLPTLDELKQMKKEAYRRFRQAIKEMRGISSTQKRHF